MVAVAFPPYLALFDKTPDEILDVAPVPADPLGKGADAKALRIVGKDHEEPVFQVASNRGRQPEGLGDLFLDPEAQVFRAQAELPSRCQQADPGKPEDSEEKGRPSGKKGPARFASVLSVSQVQGGAAGQRGPQQADMPEIGKREEKGADHQCVSFVSLRAGLKVGTVAL